MKPYSPMLEGPILHLVCFGVIESPPAPQKTYFLEIPQNMLKFGKFQKSRFFGGPEGGFGFRTLQNDFIYNYLLFLEAWRPKNAIFKKF